MPPRCFRPVRFKSDPTTDTVDQSLATIVDENRLALLSIVDMGTSVICPITAVCFAQLCVDGASSQLRYLFAGCGPELRVYQLGKDLPILRKVVLPKGTRIHGICVRDDGHVALHGGRYLAYCTISFPPQPGVESLHAGSLTTGFSTPPGCATPTACALLSATAELRCAARLN